MPRPVVGLIVNPMSGRDIRRLVAHASVVDKVEKASIVKRVILALERMGVAKLIVMPEEAGIVDRALSMMPRRPLIDIELIDMAVREDWLDTYNAATYMRGRVNALISIGGDGTNRVIAKAGIEAPLMPISTGTNNVFPYFIEATIAAMAAGVVALGEVPLEDVTFRSKRVEFWRNGELADIALVDAVATTHQFVASRAVWRLEYVHEVASGLCTPYNLGPELHTRDVQDSNPGGDEGMYVKLSRGGSWGGGLCTHSTGPPGDGLK